MLTDAPHQAKIPLQASMFPTLGLQRMYASFSILPTHPKLLLQSDGCELEKLQAAALS